MKTRLKIAFNFDRTIHYKGDLLAPYKWLKQVSRDHDCILYTSRVTDDQKLMLAWLDMIGIHFVSINIDPDQINWTDSSKCYADIYVDHRSVGIPLQYMTGDDELVVDWAYTTYLIDQAIRRRLYEVGSRNGEIEEAIPFKKSQL